MATFNWERCISLSQSSHDLYTQCAMLHNRIYVSISQPSFSTDIGKLYSISSDMTQWVEHSVLPTASSGFTTYHSKLAFVGGWHHNTKKFSKEVWTSCDGQDWIAELSPLSTFRSLPLVANTGKPEYVVVVGGIVNNKTELDLVEVLIDGQWFGIESLPRPHHSLGITIHNGNVVLMGWDSIHHCKLESLIAACVSLSDAPCSGLWQKFEAPMNDCRPVSFAKHLLAVGGDFKLAFFYTTSIYAFSPLSQMWVLVGRLPLPFHHPYCLILPTGELVVVGQNGNVSNVIEVYKATLAS